MAASEAPELLAVLAHSMMNCAHAVRNAAKILAHPERFPLGEERRAELLSDAYRDADFLCEMLNELVRGFTPDIDDVLAKLDAIYGTRMLAEVYELPTAESEKACGCRDGGSEMVAGPGNRPPTELAYEAG